MKTVSKNSPQNYKKRETSAVKTRVVDPKNEKNKRNFFNAVLTDDLYLDFSVKTKTSSK